MNSIIEDLYKGKIYPFEKFKPILHHYKNNKEEAFQGYEEFGKNLDPERRKEFEQILDNHLDLLSLEMEQNFSDGFKLGVKLMCEIFMQDDVERYLELLEKANQSAK